MIECRTPSARQQLIVLLNRATSAHPLSMREMADATGLSTSGVSGVLTLLRRERYLSDRWVPPTRPRDPALPGWSYSNLRPKEKRYWARGAIPLTAGKRPVKVTR